jgi:hypothetical protein
MTPSRTWLGAALSLPTRLVLYAGTYRPDLVFDGVALLLVDLLRRGVDLLRLLELLAVVVGAEAAAGAVVQAVDERVIVEVVEGQARLLGRRGGRGAGEVLPARQVAAEVGQRPLRVGDLVTRDVIVLSRQVAHVPPRHLRAGHGAVRVDLEVEQDQVVRPVDQRAGDEHLAVADLVEHARVGPFGGGERAVGEVGAGGLLRDQRGEVRVHAPQREPHVLLDVVAVARMGLDADDGERDPRHRRQGGEHGDPEHGP